MREVNDKRMKEVLVTVRAQVPQQPSRARQEEVLKKPTKWAHGKQRDPAAPSPTRLKPIRPAAKLPVRTKAEVPTKEEDMEERRPPLRRLISAGIQASPPEEKEEEANVTGLAPPRLSGFEPYSMTSRPRGVCLIINNETYWHENFEVTCPVNFQP